MQEHAGKKKNLRILSLAGNEYHDYVQLRSWCSEDNTRADDSGYAPFSAVCITLLYISQLKTLGFHYSTAQDDFMLFYIQTTKWTLYLMELIFFLRIGKLQVSTLTVQGMRCAGFQWLYITEQCLGMVWWHFADVALPVSDWLTPSGLAHQPPGSGTLWGEVVFFSFTSGHKKTL